MMQFTSRSSLLVYCNSRNLQDLGLLSIYLINLCWPCNIAIDVTTAHQKKLYKFVEFARRMAFLH